MTVVLAWAGPPENAIVALAARTAAAARAGCGDRDRRPATLGVADPADLVPALQGLPSTVTALHVHVNDWLFARAPGGWMAAVDGLAAAARTRRARLVLTLHDLPDPGEVSSDLGRRRAAEYRTVAGRADAVVVASGHEADRVAALTGGAVRAAVLPLPLDDARPAGAPTPEPDVVGVLGFVYPGKGHLELIEAMAGLPVRVRAIGRASDGQEYLLDRLADRARAAGVGFACTGFLPEADLTRQLLTVGVPVAAHREVSASASMNHWIAVGRRPLVAAGGYADELDRRMPGAVLRYGPGELADRVRQALADPGSTWRNPAVPVGPGTPAVAAALLDLLEPR